MIFYNLKILTRKILKIVNQKSPSVFTDISNEWKLDKINKNIDSYFKYYLTPLMT